MLLKLERPLVVFDLETTGTNPRVDRIVELAAVKVFPDGKSESLELRVNPGRLIPPQATAVHGITDQDVADSPTFEHEALRVLRFLAGCDLAGFGILRFDVPLLRLEFQRTGIDFDARNIHLLDAQRIFHQREPRDLTAALQFYCQEEHEHAHTAKGDALAAWKVIEGQCSRYSDLPRSPADLDSICNPRDPDDIDEDGKLRWRDNEAIIAFGQKSGMTLRELAEDDPGYLRWMTNKDFSPEVKAIARDALDGKFPTR